MNNYLWANAYWSFFHSFSCNLNKKYLTQNNIKLINIFVKRLIYTIPCEKCRIDTVNYFENNNFDSIHTKENYEIFFYKFHNYVNSKTNKPIAKYNILNNYRNISSLQYLRKIDALLFKNNLNKNVYKFFILISN